MSQQPIIHVQNLAKQYRLGNIGGTTLREELDGWLQNRKKGNKEKKAKEMAALAQASGAGEVQSADGKAPSKHFWALKDISFTLNQGEVLGVIGRNGAGKSTLLKILSRITEPTHGQAILRGRVSSLLEVGTGFHPELSGRENVFLNGAIHGMKKREIAKKFDEIVAFSGLEPFIDTPIKRYSSGMAVRLAFSVAAHLEPEILIIDEVLAVGDAAFQKKCLGKIKDVASGGRTVLFVSHNMSSITRLCTRALLLNKGQVEFDGSPEAAVQKYLQGGAEYAPVRTWENTPALPAPGNEFATLHAVRALNATTGKPAAQIDIREAFNIEIDYSTHIPPGGQAKPVTAIVNVLSSDGTVLFASNEFSSPAWKERPLGAHTVRAVCQVPGNLLSEGLHSVLIALGTYSPNQVHARAEEAISFHVVDGGEPGGVRGDTGGHWPGIVRPWLNWESHVK